MSTIYVPNFRLIAVLQKHNCIGSKLKAAKNHYFYSFFEPLYKFEVSGRDKVGQGCSAILEGGPLCPIILVEIFDACFQPIGYALGSSDLLCPNQS